MRSLLQVKTLRILTPWRTRFEYHRYRLYPSRAYFIKWHGGGIPCAMKNPNNDEVAVTDLIVGVTQG